MSNWPLSVSGAGPGISALASVTSGIAPSYSAWVELAASTPTGVEGIILQRVSSASGEGSTFNLAIGAAGSEVPIVSDLFNFTSNTTAERCSTIFIPVRVPPGQRLAIQTTRLTSTVTHVWRVEWVRGGGLYPLGGSQLVTYGFDLSTMLGTTLTAGASATWGTGVEVVASTPRRARYMSITGRGAHNGVVLRGLVGAFYGTSDHLCGPTFGASGPVGDNITALMIPRFAPCDIPAGSNIRLRLFEEAAVNPTRAFQLHLVY